MTDIPHAVLSDYFRDVIKGRNLHSAVFLTYKYDSGFFEKEILPIFLDIPLSHVEVIRLAQLEEALSTIPGQVAVYYDANGLVSSDAGSAKLDIRRIPVQHNTGIFHPKNVFLLVDSEDIDEQGNRPQTLIVVSLSANLTRSGWWENVEVCYAEEIEEGDKTRIKDDIIDFLEGLRRKTSAEKEHVALRHIATFLKKSTEQHLMKSQAGQLHNHFYGGGRSVADFLDETAGKFIKGAYLEIISPYYDDAYECEPLKTLIDRFQPKEVRICIPYSLSGEVSCHKKLFESVSKLPGVRWGRLGKDLLQRGKSENAGERFVHAKLYRFFTQSPKREIYFVGSVNMTSAAHDVKGNVETGVLVDLVPERRPYFWLSCDEIVPTQFKVSTEDDESADYCGTKLNLRYLWDQNCAQAFWDAPGKSPALRIEARGILMGRLVDLPSREWVNLAPEMIQRIGQMLSEISLFDVYEENKNPSLLLVQEEGMSHKPSLLLRLSVTDILRYWSFLTADQRAAFIEARAPELAFTGQGADLVTKAKIALDESTIFDRFAGYFHAFGCLERAVKAALDENRDREANYRLFGKKYDSLGTLLDRIVSAERSEDDIENYVIILCAQQMCRELKRLYPDYWGAHDFDVIALNARFKNMESIRERLLEKNPKNFIDFLEWFEFWFLKRAESVEEANA